MTSPSDAPMVAPSAALVVFGATGDLASRKLYPALTALAQRGQLPKEFAVVGVARTEMSDDDFKARVPELAKHCVSFRYVAGSYDDADTFTRLKETIDAADISDVTGGNRLY